MAIRVGVVGGGMGRSHALAYHQARPKCDLVWVADLDRSLAEKVAGETGSKPITDWTAGLGEVD
ncbi:MAG TPA: gfo/Idh/MocA family oxidoreductase, partial [Limnochordia bacterium]|nr:gfo/Idh/MocA family oxidoreductase [Limnochordia bacterium]